MESDLKEQDLGTSSERMFGQTCVRSERSIHSWLSQNYVEDVRKIFKQRRAEYDGALFIYMHAPFHQTTISSCVQCLFVKHNITGVESLKFQIGMDIH